MAPFQLHPFIAQHVTQRDDSMFMSDIAANRQQIAAAIEGKSLLVIGGAGTIGSSFIQAVIEFSPKRLFVVDVNENGLTELTRMLRSQSTNRIPDVYRTYPVDFDHPVLDKLLASEGPFEMVANFAAHKHVRSEKDHYSIEAMIDNNVFKAASLLRKLCACPPERFFCVSTDKATKPTNVMGATKKLMEKVIMSYSDRMTITTARFANVAFSQGSLLDGYLHRLRHHQPLSCPNDVRRYFVSPTESGQICMLAAVLGNSGEIFFPKLQPDQLRSFRSITDRFIEAQGFQPEVCASEEEARQKVSLIPAGKYPVYYFVTDTSGEKLFEEFYSRDDQVDLRRFSSLGVIDRLATETADDPDCDVPTMLSQLRECVDRPQGNKEGIVACLKSFIPDFQHVETGKNLDQKM